MRTVQILGLAPNLMDTPLKEGVERWCSGIPRSYRIRGPKGILDTYTRWFNLHIIHYVKTCRQTPYGWYAQQSKPIYLQQVCPDIPSSVRFPHEAIQAHFGTRFFTCSAAWLIAFAIMEGFERIELWGFELRKDHKYDWERPCFFYWVEQARQRGIDVYLPPTVEVSLPGDPTNYDGPLYGYEPHNHYYARYFLTDGNSTNP